MTDEDARVLVAIARGHAVNTVALGESKLWPDGAYLADPKYINGAVTAALDVVLSRVLMDGGDCADSLGKLLEALYV